MMKLRSPGLLIMCVLMLGALPAAAQDQNTISTLNCLGLSESDCAFVEQATANLSRLQSFTHDFTFSASVSNASQIVQGIDMAINAEGSGAVAIDPSQMTEATPYNGVNASLDINGTISDSEGEQSGEANLIIADGNVYKQDSNGAWRGTSLADLAKNPDALSVSVMGMDIPAAQVMQLGMGMAAIGSGQGDLLTDNGVGVTALLQVPGFLSQTRLPDETIDGVNTAVFSYTADIGALLTNPDVQQAIAGMSDMGGLSDDPMAQQMALMLPILLQNTSGTVTLTRWLGTDDGLPRRVVLDISAPVDLGIKSGNGTPIPPIELKLNIAVDFSDINGTSAPTAPEGATIVPAQQFMPTQE